MLEQDLITGVRFFGLVSMLALGVIVACINRGRVQSAVYNRSRWLIVMGAFFLAFQCVLMFFGHFREYNPREALLLSVLLSTPASASFGLAELNLLRAGRKMSVLIGVTLTLLFVIYVLCAIGFLTQTIASLGSLWRSLTALIALANFAMLTFLLYHEYREMKVVNSDLSDEDLDQKRSVLHYTDLSVRFTMGFSLLTPFSCMSASLMANAIVGLLIYCSLVWYICSFLLYGMNMGDVINVESEIIEAEVQAIENKTEESETKQKLYNKQPADLERIVGLIDQWVERRAYLNPRLNIVSAAKQIGISLSSLNYYLTNVIKADGYRQWIASLRIEESKRLILEHQTYTIETIASMCGFSDRSNFTRSFKAHEGVAPSIWLEKQKVGKIV